MIFDLNRVLEQIEKDKGISRDSLIEAIEAAMMSAARKKLGFYGDLEAQYNPELGEVELFMFKTVVENVEEPDLEVTVEEGKKLDPDADIGDSLGEKLDSSVLGRIAAQTAKQVIIQKLRDAEKDVVVAEYQSRVGQILSGVVRRFEKRNIVVDLGKTEAVLTPREQIPGESYKTGDRVQALLLEIDMESRNQLLILSRRHPEFLKSLFEMEVPEIQEGIVDIKSCAREPGIRAKIAVYSADSDVDPVGACVGMRGARVQSIVQELRGEKIDIVLWNPDPARFVCNAIAPAEVSKVIVKEKEKAMEIIVADDQLSLAIGRKGQNVRLAANLTSWNIDIFSESKVDEMSELDKAKLVEHLEIDEAFATILYGHAFRSVEEIVSVGREEFRQIPGLDQDVLDKIFDKALEVTGWDESEIEEDIADEEDVDEEITEVIEDNSEEE